MEGGIVVGDGGDFACILHQRVEFLHLGTIRGHVEVAREDHRVAFRIDGVDAVDDEFEAFLAGFPADVVEVGVDEVELLSALLVLEQGPGGRAAAFGIPAEGRHIRGLGQPEGAPFEHFDRLLVVEDAHVLTLALAVVAADADALVVAGILRQVLYLVVIGFLDTEHVRLLVVDHHRRGRIAELPGVRAVIGLARADVVRNDGQLRGAFLPGGKGKDEGRSHEEEEEFFHCHVISSPKFSKYS